VTELNDSHLSKEIISKTLLNELLVQHGGNIALLLYMRYTNKLETPEI
jgi:hypothetical protein